MWNVRVNRLTDSGTPNDTDGSGASRSGAAAGSRALHPASVAARRPAKRVYLMAPARWKSARSAATDWSQLPAPSAWSHRAAPTPLIFSARAPNWRMCSAAVVLRTARLCAPVFVALRRLPLREIVRAARALPTGALPRWMKQPLLQWRRSVAAVSFAVLAAAIAVPLGIDVAHSQPDLEKYSKRAPVLPPVFASSAVATTAVDAPIQSMSGFESPAMLSTPATKGLDASARPASMPDADSWRNAGASTLLSDVSTMDLMMPIAEPDLDIASHQSLWAQVGKESGVDPLLLYSIALVESKSLHPGGDLAPTPWLFRVNDHLVVGERHHVQLQMAAASQLNAAVQDVGIMQVYYPMHRSAVRDPLTLLDPKTNISVAAKILHDGMHETHDPVLGVGYYHSHTPQLARDYGEAVMVVYQRLKGLYRSGKNTGITAR
jgi:hypothetical protein